MSGDSFEQSARRWSNALSLLSIVLALAALIVPGAWIVGMARGDDGPTISPGEGARAYDPSIAGPTSLPRLLPESPPPSEAMPTLRATSAPPVATVPARQAVSPERLLIPSIELDVLVEPVGWFTIQLDGALYGQWQVPDHFAAGWHLTSAGLGERGNTVLNGHHNVYGQVFRRLEEVRPGDELTLIGGQREYAYTVEERTILAERGEPIEARLRNADWVMPTDDERVTLITCWPYTSNTHRLVLVARPAGLSKQAEDR
jgi:sortase A